LIKEILKGIKTQEPNSMILDTYMYAIRLVLVNGAGKVITEETCENLIDVLRSTQQSSHGKQMAAGCLGALYSMTKHASIKATLSNGPEIQDCSVELMPALQAAFSSIAIEQNLNLGKDSDPSGFVNEQLQNLVKIVNKAAAQSHSAVSEVMPHAATAFGFVINKIISTEKKENVNAAEAINYKQLFESLYKKCDNNPEMKTKIWNCSTWAIYNSFPIQIEVQQKFINKQVMTWICNMAEKCGSKNEPSNMVKKAADESILAFIGQCGLNFVKEACEEEGCVNVHNAIETRLKKNSVVCNPDDQVSVVPVTFMNVDSTLL